MLRKHNIVSDFMVLKDYWQLLCIFGTIIFFGLYIYIENRNYGSQVDLLTQSNQQLQDRISRLEGQMDVTNTTITMYLENHPSMFNYRIQKLEEQIVKSTLKPIIKREVVYQPSSFSFTPLPYSFRTIRYDTENNTINPIATSAATDVEKKKTLFQNLFGKKDKH